MENKYHMCHVPCVCVCGGGIFCLWCFVGFCVFTTITKVHTCIEHISAYVSMFSVCVYLFVYICYMWMDATNIHIAHIVHTLSTGHFNLPCFICEQKWKKKKNGTGESKNKTNQQKKRKKIMYLCVFVPCIFDQRFINIWCVLQSW